MAKRKIHYSDNVVFWWDRIANHFMKHTFTLNSSGPNDYSTLFGKFYRHYSLHRCNTALLVAYRHGEKAMVLLTQVLAMFKSQARGGATRMSLLQANPYWVKLSYPCTCVTDKGAYESEPNETDQKSAFYPPAQTARVRNHVYRISSRWHPVEGVPRGLACAEIQASGMPDTPLEAAVVGAESVENCYSSGAKWLNCLPVVLAEFYGPRTISQKS
ncbi:unnamed protein product [Protopolystoma xenopodis]|uniref:Uncharacterized protein n=1 Tax=Protopolystoma xenopodis TaxID=117903 RepID=A0A3S5BRG1_9PLAT|nr:unnamed protein product [Protopolystoma xenopodis]